MSAKHMDTFTRAYIGCALWSSTDNANEQGGEPLDANYCADDIAPATLARMVEDCEDFQRANSLLLSRYRNEGFDDASAGHDFWLTRNRHGAGFWDRGLGAIGNELTAQAHAYGSFDLYVGDDGKVYGQ